MGSKSGGEFGPEACLFYRRTGYHYGRYRHPGRAGNAIRAEPGDDRQSSSGQGRPALLRNTIELYATRHGNVAPGYKGNDPDRKPKEKYFRAQTIQQEGYLRKMPVNPFNHRDSILIVDNSQAFPSEARGEHGWIYQPATLTVRLDWPGTDDDGVPYFEY